MSIDWSYTHVVVHKRDGLILCQQDTLRTHTFLVVFFGNIAIISVLMSGIRLSESLIKGKNFKRPESFVVKVKCEGKMRLCPLLVLFHNETGQFFVLL